MYASITNLAHTNSPRGFLVTGILGKQDWVGVYIKSPFSQTLGAQHFETGCCSDECLNDNIHLWMRLDHIIQIMLSDNYNLSLIDESTFSSSLGLVKKSSSCLWDLTVNVRGWSFRCPYLPQNELRQILPIACFPEITDTLSEWSRSVFVPLPITQERVLPSIHLWRTIWDQR